ncbi:MAG: LptF/LptG family permease [Armatimonadetes bacterium]|nr:LptF/LptG family permease [Armatimonadota bacterium]
MKRIDRLILGELFGPWAFGVAIFTVLIMAGSFLFQLTDYLAKGVAPFTVFKVAMYLTPGVMAKTFSMAMLLGTLLAFGRLSGDSEIVALRAGGVSVPRIIIPVGVFGLVVSLVAYWMTDFLVPAAATQATALKSEIAKQLSTQGTKATSIPLMEEGKMVGQLMAKNFDILERELTGVTIVGYNGEGNPEYFLLIDKLQFTDLEEWQASGSSKVIMVKDGSIIESPDGFWPDAVDEARPEDFLARDLRDLDTFSSKETAEQIKKMRAEPEPQWKQIYNLEYGFYNKFSVPLAAFVFGLVGAPLGIRNHRAGNATGFWQSVLIIFGYFLIGNVMGIMAQGGAIPSWTASFMPIVIGIVVSVYLIRRKNIS